MGPWSEDMLWRTGNYFRDMYNPRPLQKILEKTKLGRKTTLTQRELFPGDTKAQQNAERTIRRSERDRWRYINHF